MPSDHPIRCRCGSFTGRISPLTHTNHGVCYCRDCQAFAHFLGRADEVLDARGGTELVQTRPQHVTFTTGTDRLACMRLTPRGLLRWYASCCNTPIGNTSADYRNSFVGLVHTCLRTGAPLDDVFGPARWSVFGKSARGEPKPKMTGALGTIRHAVGMMLGARITGRYRHTPFFEEGGAPVVAPRVLSPSEHDEVMRRVSAAHEAP